MVRKNRWYIGMLGALALLSASCVEVDGSFDMEESYGQEGARVAVRGKPVVVPEGKIHYGDVVVVDGKADIQGEVTGSVVVVAGDLKVGPKAVIAEDLVGVGNERSLIASDAQVKGERVTVRWAGVQWLVDTTLFAWEHPVFVAVSASVAFLLVCLLGWLLVIRPYDSRRFHYSIAEHPIRAGLLGLLITAALHVLIVLAFVSRWGVGLVPVLGLVLLVLTVLGWVVIGGHVGRWLARKYRWKTSPFLYGLIGFCIVMVTFSLPVVGQLATVFASWIGIGALLAPSQVPDDYVEPDPYTPKPTPQARREALPEPDTQPDSNPAQATNHA